MTTFRSRYWPSLPSQRTSNRGYIWDYRVYNSVSRAILRVQLKREVQFLSRQLHLQGRGGSGLPHYLLMSVFGLHLEEPQRGEPGDAKGRTSSWHREWPRLLSHTEGSSERGPTGQTHGMDTPDISGRVMTTPSCRLLWEKPRAPASQG